MSAPEPDIREAFALEIYFAHAARHTDPETGVVHGASAMAYLARMSGPSLAEALRRAADVVADWPPT
jgi:hypothetical protein